MSKRGKKVKMRRTKLELQAGGYQGVRMQLSLIGISRRILEKISFLNMQK